MTKVPSDDSENTQDVLEKPRLRGVSHKYAFYVSLIAGALLVATVADAKRSIALIYVLSLSSLLGVSAMYHRINWTEEKRAWMRRLDHTMIFVLIAGSYTPMSVLVLEGSFANTALIIVWLSVVAGAIFNLMWGKAPKWVSATIYLAVSWVLVATFPELYERLGLTFVSLLGLGGLFYTVGALAYAFKRPNPWPGVFGYHEVFHACVVAAAGLHFAALSTFVFEPLS